MPVRPATTFEETVERLGSAIRLGLLAPGSKLPPERELAQRLRISRSTLRQALAAPGGGAGAGAADLPLAPAAGADGAGAERAPGLAAGTDRRHLRRRRAATL